MRLSTLGLFGSMPVAVTIDSAKHTLAPLVVAMLMAAHAADFEKFMNDD